MNELIPLARKVAERLRARGQNLAVAESSAGGLISASLLAIAGASDYFLGGGVIYTARARSALLGLEPGDLKGIRSASEPYVALLAGRLRERLGADWALAESGASGPSGNRYGDAPGHAVLAVGGPVERVKTLATGRDGREENMRVFAAAALTLLIECLDAG